MRLIDPLAQRAKDVHRPKIAFVHEWFTTYAGSEKVLEAMIGEYPDADLFSLIDFMTPETRQRFGNKQVRTSFLQKLPWMRTNYRAYLSLMPLAVAQLDMSGYDLIVSNSHAVAKGVITGPDQLHICYCYSPMRYAWDLQHQYLAESDLTSGLRSLLTRWVLHRMQIWDVQTAHSVDHFIACSEYIARRIKKAYRRDATVIYPNVAVDEFTIGSAPREAFYLTASRMVPYKKMHLIVEAFAALPDRQLIVIGDGPQFNRIKSLAGPNVRLLGDQPHEVLLEHMQKARAFLFAAEEDFGITSLEAQACGTPVLVFARGGASENVVDGVTGLYFSAQSAEAISQIVRRFESMPGFQPERIRAHAESFSTERFRAEFRNFVDASWVRHENALRASRRVKRASHRDLSIERFA